MDELTNASLNTRQKRQSHPLRFLLKLFVLLIFGSLIFYCLLIPVTTGQSCPDPLSGHVPTKAEEIFLDKLVNGIVAQDFDALAKISNAGGLDQLRELGPIATKNYEITFRDDLARSYERELQFENGTVVHLTFHGSWSCPDFIVTEQEVFERLTLTKIRLDE